MVGPGATGARPSSIVTEPDWLLFEFQERLTAQHPALIWGWHMR